MFGTVFEYFLGDPTHTHLHAYTFAADIANKLRFKTLLAVSACVYVCVCIVAVSLFLLCSRHGLFLRMLIVVNSRYARPPRIDCLLLCP